MGVRKPRMAADQRHATVRQQYAAMAEAEVANINTVAQVLRDSLEQMEDRNNQLEAALGESQREIDSLQDQLQQSETVAKELQLAPRVVAAEELRNQVATECEQLLEEKESLLRITKQELTGMEDTMMREISKKDAELAAAYIKLEEQAVQLAKGSETQLGGIQAIHQEVSRERERREAAEGLASQERLMRYSLEEQLAALRSQAGNLSSALEDKETRLRQLASSGEVDSAHHRNLVHNLQEELGDVKDALRKARGAESARKSKASVGSPSSSKTTGNPRTPGGRMRAPPSAISPRRALFSAQYVNHIMECARTSPSASPK